MDDVIPENPCGEVEPSVLYPSDDRGSWRIGLERLATKYFGPDAPFDPEDIFDLSDLRPRVVTTFKPTPRLGWTELLAEKTNGIFPPYGRHYTRTLRCPIHGEPMLIGKDDVACQLVDCRYAHGWIAASQPAELVDDIHPDGGAQQPSS